MLLNITKAGTKCIYKNSEVKHYGPSQQETFKRLSAIGWENTLLLSYIWKIEDTLVKVG
jgi:hypothetical protein